MQGRLKGNEEGYKGCCYGSWSLVAALIRDGIEWSCACSPKVRNNNNTEYKAIMNLEACLLGP